MSNCHKYNTRITTGKLKRKVLNSDLCNDSDNESDSDYEYTSDSDKDSNIDISDLNYYDEHENKEIVNNKLKYYKFLNKLFPSSYSKKQINDIKRQRCISPNNNELKLDFNNKSINKSSKSSKSNKSNKNVLDDFIVNDYDNSSESENNDDDDDDDENDSDNSELSQANSILSINKLKKLVNKNHDNKDKNINIILNLKDSTNNFNNYENNNDDDAKFLIDNLYNGNNGYGEEDEEDEDDEDEDEDDEDEDNENGDIEKTNKKSKSNSKSKNTYQDAENEIIENKDSIIPAPKKTSIKNYKLFSKILNDDDGEASYFKNNLSKTQQEEYIQKLNAVNKLTSVPEPYLIHLLNLDISDKYKACALRKINILRSMGGSFGNSEYYKIKSWVDAFIKLPFNKYNNLPITFADGIDKCHDFMENAKKTLDEVTYGLEDAKMQIMQMIGLWLVNPNAVGSAIAIKGPPGTGKTTLIKDGISKILNRPFALIALGGCGDSGYLDGHDYTYEGSKYGRIIDILIKSGCMNPVILFDELDKISDSPRGQEITGVLTHLTDITQNSNFSDKYMSEIDLDMSKALYIFSYNDESSVNPILKDRMYKIETKGYKTKDKLIISKEYLLPKICEQSKFEKQDILFCDDVLEYIINDFTEKESGVRNLKRCLEIIYTKLNLYRLMKPDINLFEKSEAFKLKEKVEFPFKLTRDVVDKLIIKGEDNKIPFGMYN